MLEKMHVVTAVAVIRRADGKVYPDYYTFPGGKVQDNDTITYGLKYADVDPTVKPLGEYIANLTREKFKTFSK